MNTAYALPGLTIIEIGAREEQVHLMECHRCHGSGESRGRQCERCHGRGELASDFDWLVRHGFTRRETCHKCGGHRTCALATVEGAELMLCSECWTKSVHPELLVRAPAHTEPGDELPI